MNKFFDQHFMHGGDYNPEQWLDRPDILEEDIRLMKLAHVNNVSLGIFFVGIFRARRRKISV